MKNPSGVLDNGYHVAKSETLIIGVIGCALAVEVTAFVFSALTAKVAKRAQRRGTITPKKNIRDLIKRRNELRKKYGSRYEANTEKYCDKRWDVDAIKTFIKYQIVPEGLGEQALVFDLQVGDFFIEVSLNDQFDVGYGLALDYEIRKTDNSHFTDGETMGRFNIDIPTIEHVELEMLRLLDECIQSNNLDYGEVKN